MPPEESRLRKLEHELYTSEHEPPHKRSVIHDVKIHAPDDWRDANAPSQNVMRQSTPMPTSFFKKLFTWSLGLLGLAVVILGISLISGGNSISARNVDIEIVAKTFVDGGESLPVEVIIKNRNRVPLELATLILEFPEGNAVNVDAMARMNRDLGTIPSGDTRNEVFTVQLYGQEGTEKSLRAYLEFRVPGSNAVYDTESIASVTVRTSPIRLTMEAPDAVISNQEFPLKFTMVSNSSETLIDTALVVEYPAGFSVVRTDPTPSAGNNVWNLGDVPPGSERTITIYGTIAGGANELKTIRASLGSQNARNEQTLDKIYTNLAQVIPITNAFLDARIMVDNGTGATIPISANEQVRVEIPWQNTLSTAVTNAEIHVNLSGTAYDPSRVMSNMGYFDSANNRIIWSRQQQQAFASLEPGASGTLAFNLQPKQFAGNQIVANPSIVLSVDVIGFAEGGIKQTARNVDTKTLTINSDINMLARTIHYSGLIQNTGPMPMQVNKETTYTLEWQVTNFRNRVTGVRVSTILPSYVDFKNVLVPQSELANVSYNTVTRELIWNVGDVPAGTGGSIPARTLSFKVGITPSVNQNGTVPELTGDIMITGNDTFTGAVIDSSKRPMTTRLLNDSSTVGASGKVGSN